MPCLACVLTHVWHTLKMKRANFGENGIGAKTKEQMSALFAQTHKGFTLDAYA